MYRTILCKSSFILQLYLARKPCNMQNAADCVDVSQADVVQVCDLFGDVAQFKDVADFFVVVLKRNQDKIFRIFISFFAENSWQKCVAVEGLQ